VAQGCGVRATPHPSNRNTPGQALLFSQVVALSLLLFALLGQGEKSEDDRAGRSFYSQLPYTLSTFTALTCLVRAGAPLFASGGPLSPALPLRPLRYKHILLTDISSAIQCFSPRAGAHILAGGGPLPAPVRAPRPRREVAEGPLRYTHILLNDISSAIRKSFLKSNPVQTVHFHRPNLFGSGRRSYSFKWWRSPCSCSRSSGKAGSRRRTVTRQTHLTNGHFKPEGEKIL